MCADVYFVESSSYIAKVALNKNVMQIICEYRKTKCPKKNYSADDFFFINFLIRMIYLVSKMGQ